MRGCACPPSLRVRREEEEDEAPRLANRARCGAGMCGRMRAAACPSRAYGMERGGTEGLLEGWSRDGLERMRRSEIESSEDLQTCSGGLL